MSALSEQARNPEQEARQEFGFRFGIGMRVEEMGYGYPALVGRTQNLLRHRGGPQAQGSGVAR